MVSQTSVEKIIPLLVLGVMSIVSLALIYTRNYKNDGGFMRVVKNDRASTALVVQILSSLFGLMQTYVAICAFKFATRIRILQRSTSLRTLYLFTALAGPKADFGLPTRSFILAIIIVVLSHGPGALWAGALTPISTTIRLSTASIQIPTFTSDTENFWNNEFQRCGAGDVDVCNVLTNCLAVNNQLGFISTCPVPDLQGALLVSGSSATSISGSLTNHSKIDNPGWSYQGRSYGVASSQGIFFLDGLSEGQGPISYSYTESGYNVGVSCTTNTSADFGIQFQYSKAELSAWYVIGNLSNSVPGNPEFYPTITWSSTSKNTPGGPSVLGWSTVVNPDASNRNMIAIAAAGSYITLNQTQCTVEFVPRAFEVSANLTSQTIIVDPLLDVNNMTDIEPSGKLANNVMWSLNLLSRMTPSLYESTLGNTLQKNINTLLARPDLAMTNETATLLAISDSFTAMLDDILVAFGSSQLGIANSSTSTPVSVVLPAVQIGQDKYIFAAAGVNLCLLLLLLEEGVRTKFWHALPLFDYGNIKAVVLAASADRGGIARQVAQKYERAGTTWSGDSGDKNVDEVNVQLVEINVKGGMGFECVLQALDGTEDVGSREDVELDRRNLL
jgi:hypothetical protein